MVVSKEKSCAFYASDYHFEMIILPYINKKLQEDKNIYVFTQNNLEETINVLVEKVNLKNEVKENILNINWKDEDNNKYDKLIKDNKEKIVFIKGNEEYIEKINNNLKQIEENNKIEIIDCYNVEEVENKMMNISKKYKKILVTSKI